MKTTLYALALMTLLFGLVGTGCYTQVGSTRDDRFSDEYQNEPAVTEEPAAVDDTLESTTTDPYFDEYGYPRQRWYLGYSPPLWVGVTYGWYDPWYYRPWYNDIFWCWNPPLAYYSPWWYPSPWYDYHTGWYGGHYSSNGRYATTRSIGSTRGSGGGRGTMGSSRGGYESPGRSGAATQDLPIGARQGAPAGRTQPGVAAPGKRMESVKGSGPAVRTSPAPGSRSREATRPAQRPRSRGEQTQAPPTYNPPAGSQGGGARTGVSTPPPAPRPSGNDGGTRGSGSSRGGGGGRR